MKIVFVGPSLPDAEGMAQPDITLRPPARQGDVMQALEDGATAIGLIDGYFEFAAPVWHKELLFALSRQVPVFGASSMGALRAAECAAFGMIGIGRIFEDYARGDRIDDGDVALQHGPAELRFPALTVPMVNVDSTLAAAVSRTQMSRDQAERLTASARSIFYKERTWKAVALKAQVDWSALEPVIRTCWVDQKRLDAIALLDAISTSPAVSSNVPEWSFNTTPLWRRLYGHVHKP